MFINPFGGKGHGERIYERKVAPLFSLASITTEVIGKGRGCRPRGRQLERESGAAARGNVCNIGVPGTARAVLELGTGTRWEEHRRL